MSRSSFQFSLRHLFIAITLGSVALCLLVILSHQRGTREQLPREERVVLELMEKDGLRFPAKLGCSFGPQAKATIRWFNDGQFHVVGIEVQNGEDFTWLPHCHRLPKLRSLRIMDATNGTMATVRYEFRNSQVKVEYFWNGKWVPARSDS